MDALEGLADCLPSLVLVGAQAVYLQVGEADLAVAPYTTDADLALDPRLRRYAETDHFCSRETDQARILNER